jgi:hypothetical protein
LDELSEDDSDYDEGSDEEFLTDEEEEEMSDDISESDSMEDEDEELENEEGVDDENDESVSEPEVPSIEQPTIENVIETETTFTEVIQPSSSPPSPPPPQTQTPPITPDQPSTSRKRPLPADEDEPTTDDIPLHQEPSPVTIIEKVEVLRNAKSREQHIEERKSVINEKKQELEFLETIYRLNGNKRRRIDDEETGKKGWTSVAATVGKYTIAGVVGGIATLVGLAWAENQGF